MMGLIYVLCAQKNEIFITSKAIQVRLSLWCSKEVIVGFWYRDHAPKFAYGLTVPLK